MLFVEFLNNWFELTNDNYLISNIYTTFWLDGPLTIFNKNWLRKLIPFDTLYEICYHCLII